MLTAILYIKIVKVRLICKDKKQLSWIPFSSPISKIYIFCTFGDSPEAFTSYLYLSVQCSVGSQVIANLFSESVVNAARFVEVKCLFDNRCYFGRHVVEPHARFGRNKTNPTKIPFPQVRLPFFLVWLQLEFPVRKLGLILRKVCETNGKIYLWFNRFGTHDDLFFSHQTITRRTKWEVEHQ